MPNVVLDPINEFVETITAKGELLADTPGYRVWIDDQGNRYICGTDNKFHMIFIKLTGFTMKWGETREDDPAYNPFGPEIADIELTKRCAGIRDASGVPRVCSFCYKCNNATNTEYMSLDTFKHVFELIDKPKTLTQIAFGTDASLSEEANPDYWKIFQYCKDNGVTPNVTVADVDEATAERMADTFGACAVSYYPMVDKNRCYDSVSRIHKAARRKGRLMAINIHALVAEETYDELMNLIEDSKTDSRLKGLNAIVFLSLKQKGRGANFNRISDDKFTQLISACFDNGIRFGMDSCTAPKFLEAIKDRPDYEQMRTYIEPCESLMYSSYIDCNATFYPCSFMEKEGDWATGIDLRNCTDFVKDVWYADKSNNWRKAALCRMDCNHGCNTCPYYNV